MINLIIADDHTVLRQALCEMLEAKQGYKVMAQASNGEELIEALKSHHPDVVILDVTMPKLGGIEALQRINSNPNPPPVLILSANEGEMTVRSALKAGARGFIPKNVTHEELTFAIQSILKGQTYLSPSITSSLVTKPGVDGQLTNPLQVLTKREVEILTLLSQGKRNRDIAKMLHISIRTVDTHRSNILKKLKVRTNADLVRLSLANGLITL
jgi:DNA-binding NarL/FixJ family response regulator